MAKGPFTDKEDELITSMIADGHRLTDIARHISRAPGTVRNRALRIGAIGNINDVLKASLERYEQQIDKLREELTMARGVEKRLENELALVRRAYIDTAKKLKAKNP